MNLDGKTALVTGGAVRLGRALCEALAARGCRVVVHCRESREEAAALARRLSGHGRKSLVVCGDLGSEQGCRAILADARAAAGAIDFLVNNASVFHCRPIRLVDGGLVERDFRINLFAPLALIRDFARQTKRGAVVNVLDERVSRVTTGEMPYWLTKRALADLTLGAALELAPRIRVNAVAPGPVLAPVEGSLPARKRKAGKIPLGARPTPADVADAVVYLLESEAVTGQIVYVDGGRHLLD